MLEHMQDERKKTMCTVGVHVHISLCVCLYVCIFVCVQYARVSA